MKGDDDTFVRVDAIINEARKVRGDRSLYIGNINYFHEPLRSGKWAVTYEVLHKSCFSFLVLVFYLFPGISAPQVLYVLVVLYSMLPIILLFVEFGYIACSLGPLSKIHC